MNREEYARYFNSKLPDELKKYLIIDYPDELKDFEKACPEVTRDGYTRAPRIYLALIGWLRQQM